MSEKQICRLCCTTCNEYKSLQTDLEERNETYNIAVKYFNPTLLTQDEFTSVHTNPVVCQDCWFHINKFHKFQQKVFQTRMFEEGKTQLKKLLTDIKQEEIQESVPSANITNNENDEGYLLKKNLKHGDIKTGPLLGCKDALESEHKQTDEDEDSFAIDEEHEENSLDVNEEWNEDELSSTTKSKNEKLRKVSGRIVRKPREQNAIIAEWKPEVKCDLCSETFKNFDKLSTHFKEKHKTKAYVKCCNRKFSHRYLLVNHIQLHLNPDKYKCDICGKSSTTNYNLKIHKMIMHEEANQLKCNICEKLFKRKRQLERHLLTHSTSSKDFICSGCGKRYDTEESLKLHIRHIHNAHRVCDQCGKNIYGSKAFKKHLMEHAGVELRKFPCNICGTELKTAKTLKSHKSIYHNDGLSIYVCSVCGKVARSENSLLNHKKAVHSKERKHKCTYCDKTFKELKPLREHIATHTREVLYKCLYCPKTFRTNTNLYLHRKRVHPEEWKKNCRYRPQYPSMNNNQDKKQIVIY